MSLSRPLKKKLAVSIALALLFLLAVAGVVQYVLVRKDVDQQLQEISQNTVQKIILDFKRDFLISTRYIASALDRDEAGADADYFKKIADTYGADEITLVAEDGAVLFSHGNRTYSPDFNAKLDGTFRPVLKELFAANEATSEITGIGGLRLVCAGKMSHGKTIFIAYPPERIAYRFLSHLTNFAYTMSIRKSGYVLIFDERETIISDMRGGGGFGNTAEKIGFAKSRGLSALKAGTLYSDKIHGKNAYFELERFDDYTVMAVLPHEEVLLNVKRALIVSAVCSLAVFAALFASVAASVSDALSETEDRLSAQGASEFEDDDGGNVLKNLPESPEENIAGADGGDTAESEHIQSYGIMELSSRVAADAMSRMEGKNARFIVQIDPNTSSRFFGNGDDVETLLRCLCRNAAKFTEKGLVALRIETKPEFSFSVIDTGRGMHEDELERLKKPAGELSGTEQEGSFSRARIIIEKLGGTCAIQSAYGKGSAFTVTLPHKEASAKTCAECHPELFDNAQFDKRRTKLKNIPGAKLRSILTD